MSKESFAVGGQAVIEGVMMRGQKMYCLAVRNVDNNKIVVENTPLKTNKYKFLKLPLIRGVLAFIQSLILGLKIITRSAELSGLDQLEDGSKEASKFEKWLENKLGDKISDFIIYFSVFVSVILSILIFIVLPVWISSFFTAKFSLSSLSISVIEGLLRILIFIIYIFITSRLKDVQRIFMYHGAEHKTINCYESGAELTVENVKKHTRLHKRCGTSFLIIVMIVSMLFFMFIKTNDIWLRTFSRIVFVPLIAGISYEIIKLAGKYDNFLINLISAPGLMLQRFTTKEPEDAMIEVAIASLKGVLENDK